MSSVTINGHTYTDDANPATGLGSGGHRTRFVPALADVVVVADQVASNAATAAAAAAAAVTGASTSATSTTSLAIGTGAKSLTIQSGKSIVIGMTVKIAVTADGTAWMAGDVTAYNSGNGALSVNVVATNGAGTFAAWTVSLSGPVGTGVPSSAGQTGKFLTNDGTTPSWSSVLKETGGRIGIGITATSFKLEVSDNQNGIGGFNLTNTDAGSAAEVRVAASSNAGATFLRQISTVAGAWGGLFSSGSGGIYIGTLNAAKTRLITNNTDRVVVHETDGSVNFKLGAGAIRLNGHISRYESGPITPATGAAVYAALTHGGTRPPDDVNVFGRCKLAINGLSVGDEVDLTNMRIGRNATGIVVRQVATPTYSYGAGLSANATATNFDIYVRAGWK